MGNAKINVPLYLYQYYGDIRILQFKHDIMVDYMNYLINRAAGQPYINDGGLGDWEGIGVYIMSSSPLGSTEAVP